jgi:hypothetical protein
MTALLLVGAGPSPQERPAADCTVSTKEWARPERERWRDISAQTVSISRGRPARQSPPGAFEIRNFIDEEIFATMTSAGIQPAAGSSDEEFLRRVMIDLTGQIPDTNALNMFIADQARDKRARTIDTLLASNEYADRWTMWFGDLVQNVQFSTFTAQTAIGRNAFYVWIRDSFRANKPYDQMVREVLAGKGDSFIDGPPNYVVRQLQPNGPIQDTYDNLAAHSSERFLAIPLTCVSCHGGFRHLETVNTYLAGRTREDFWKQAAFFARTGVRGVPDPANNNARKYFVSENPQGEYRLNTRDGNKTARQPAPGGANFVTPAFFLSGEAPAPAESRREAYGRMLTGHPQFARATVNYMWREMFGLGLVEPADSMDLLRLDTAQLPPGLTLQTLHPRLLDRLTEEFRKSGYDLRALLRLIANSSAYQLSMTYSPGPWNETWTPYFARHYARRLSSEVLLDAIFRATGIAAQMEILAPEPVSRAMLLPDPLELRNRLPYGRFLNTFGRGDRDDTPRSDDSSIAQSLALLNDPLITLRIKQNSGGSTVRQTLAVTRDPAKVTEALYLATLSRRPTSSERSIAVEYLQSGDINRKTEDLQHVLFNTLEFQFN